MDSKTFFDNFEIVADAPGGIARLRELIFDLAVRGNLLDQMMEEDRPDFVEVNGLFEIADNWIWTSIDKIGIVNPRNSREQDSDAGFVPMTHVQTSISVSHGFEVRKWSSIKKGYTHLANGDVAVAKITPCFENGKSCLIQNLPNGIGAGTTELLVVRPNGVLPEYILIYLKSPLFRENGIPRMTGTAGQKRLPTGYFKNFPLPLPPRAEQERIAAKVEELMALCDEFEAAQDKRNLIRASARKSAIDAISTSTTPEELAEAWKRISNNWITIADTPESISALRSLILDLAVRGSLDTSEGDVHQAPIPVEVEKLKLDKDKLWALSTALPEPAHGWSRVPMARLGQWGSGGTPTASRKEYYQSGTIPWAVIGDLNNSIMLKTESLITKKALESSSTKMIPIGAVLVAMYGASIGKSAVSGIECCTNQAIAHCVVDEDVITREYMFLVIKSLKNHLIDMGKGAAQPNISQSVLKHLVIDIPPLSIQKKVIERTDELLDLCNQIEISLSQRLSLEESIAKTMTRTVAA